MPWQPIVVLPNLDVQVAVEGNFAAIVGYRDRRLVALRRRNPVFRRFLNRFKDAFKRIQRPSVLLVRTEAPDAYRHAEAIAGFRDLLATSVIPYTRAWVLQHGRTSLDPLFGNSFAFYPWMVDRSNEGLLAMTPAMSAWDEVDSFNGQANPEVPYRPLTEVDEPLLADLIARWERRFGTDQPSWEDRALFRSLNMAFHAAQTPFVTAGTTYDIGRLVALWVSAFEILAHGGAGTRANKIEVWRVLAGNPPAAVFNRNTHICPTLRQWVYERLYMVRNDYLHGNPVDNAGLVVPGASYGLGHYAPVLYRLMLTEFLGLHFVRREIRKDDPEWATKFGTEAGRAWEFNSYQKRCEVALRTILGGTPRQHRRVLRVAGNDVEVPPQGVT